MGRAYYYFSASLPMINFESHPPMSLEDFLADCERLMESGDYQTMQELLSDENMGLRTQSTTARSWQSFQREFLNEMAYFRAERAQQEPGEHARGPRSGNPNLVNVIQQAAKNDNLLESEKLMDKTRWQFLDDLETTQNYNFEFVLIYGLKLKILCRHKLFDSPKGKGIFEEFKKMDIKEENSSE